ncbi:MAG: hypothetical protein AAYR33_03415 [Acetobacteraceae bacterium]
MGPEPLGADFSPDYLSAAISQKSSAIKTILLDQRVVAGLGNIYVCEILFRARVNPFTKGRDLTAKNISHIVRETHQVLAAAIAAGPRHYGIMLALMERMAGIRTCTLSMTATGRTAPNVPASRAKA